MRWSLLPTILAVRDGETPPVNKSTETSGVTRVLTCHWLEGSRNIAQYDRSCPSSERFL
jgi:hypothetical protein